MQFLLLISLSFLSTVLHADTLVFMVEDQHGKHIAKSNDLKNYQLVTKGSDWNLYPAISSDAHQLAYISGKDATHLKLVVKNRVTGQQSTLTEEGFILHPHFIQNQNQLLFSVQDKGVNKIGKINLNEVAPGSYGKINFLTTKVSSFFPSSFQNGEKVVFQRNNTRKEIVVLDVKAKKEEVIGFGMAPTVSKDERYIAYTSELNANWDIYVYDRFEKTTRKVTTDSARDFSPTFDRYNNLIFTSDRNENGVFSIYKQSYFSWSNDLGIEELLFSKTGVSFYAPRISGDENIRISQMPKMIGEPRSSFGAINHLGKIYIVGGHQGPEHTYPPESFTGRVTSFDTTINMWRDRAPRLNPSHGFQVAAFGKYLYAFGGFAYEASTNPKWKSISVVERYNIKEDKWEEVGHMPRNRSSNAAVKIGSKVYLIGGWDATPKFDNDIDGTFHDEIDVFNLKTETWSTMNAKLPLKRRAFSAFEKEGKIYLLGGISESGSHFSLLDNFTEFDPQTETFKELTPLPFATFAPATGSIGHHAYVFGGMFKTGEWDYDYISHIYVYDFDTSKWSHTGRYLSETKGFSAVVPLQNCLAVLGGHSYQNNRDKPVESFEKFCANVSP
ncbi:MAG: hypothetical protein CME62_06490 [Halobacteriovoraceae bacterium]|nr:hypothetical protein [Halobacteriovoraceae bacterium]|tara:strand:+ start:14692 stop:16530 length:1839 start_codon:yes stop_codon:yes gene_type:complete